MRTTTSTILMMAMLTAGAFGHATEGVLEVIPTDNITDDSELELDGARGVGIFTIGERTYAAVVAYYDDGVQILDLTDPANISATDRITDNRRLALNGAAAIAIFTIDERTYAAVAAYYDDGVQVLDVTDPANISATDRITDNGHLVLKGARGIATFKVGEGTYAAVAGHKNHGVQVLDVTDPANISATDHIYDTGRRELYGARDIATFDIGDSTYAAVSGLKENGVQMLDLSNPDDIKAMGRIVDDDDHALGSPAEIATFRNGERTYAVVAANTDNGVQLLDVSDPANPAWSGQIADTPSLKLHGATGIAMFEMGARTYAAVASWSDNGVQLLDLNDPNDIRPAGQLSDDDTRELAGALDVAIYEIGDDTYAAVAGHDDDGVQVVRITAEAPEPEPSTEVSLTVDPLEVVESAGSQAVRVTGRLNGGARTADTPVTVAVGSASDTAVEGTDYAEVEDLELSIPANRTDATVTFTLRPSDDDADEERETISVSGEAAGLTVTPAELVLVDDDALTRLSSLSLAGIDIGTFDPGTLSYSASVAHDVEVTTVTAVAVDPGAAVSLAPADGDARSSGHQVALAVGATEIAVTVTTASATAARIYRVVVTRAASDDATLSSLTLTDVELGEFAPETTGYGATVDHAVSSTLVTATPSHGAATVEISDGDGGTAGTERTSALRVGENRIEVAVTAADGTTERTYAVTVTRAALLTGRFVTVPALHDGSSSVTLRLEFSEPVSTSYRTLRDEAFEVAGGDVRGARRVDGRSDLWDIGVLPYTTGDLTAVLPATADCADAGAVCTAAGTPLSAAVEATVPGPATRPRVAGVPQVGATLTATLAADADADAATHRWLRDGVEIAGATGSGYVVSAADAGASLSVRATYGGVARTSEGTIPIWGAPGSPAVGADEEELFATTMTVGSTDAYPLRQGGYGRLSRADFGSLDEATLAIDGTAREVTAAAINGRGEFVLVASPALGGADGVTVLWDGHRIGPLTAKTSGTEGAYWSATTPQPAAEYRRYPDGSSDGVRVALSVRRELPDPVAAVAAVDESVVEGEPAQWEVTLDRAPDEDVAVSVEVSSQAGAGAGEVLGDTAPSTVTVEAGTTGARLSLATEDDLVVEDGGTATVTLERGSGYTLGEETAATVTVADDDEAVFEVAAAPAEVVEGGTSTLTVAIRDGVSFAWDRTLDISVTGDVSSTDYALESGTLELAAGAVSVTTTLTALEDDVDDEGEETARLGVSLAGVEVGSATVTIVAASTDATLADLSLTDVEMEAFDPETTRYAATVVDGASSTVVTATPAHGAAAVAISDARGSTLGTERTSSLEVGGNAIEAKVTAQDGVSERTYAVTVKRPPAWGARLPGRDIALGRGEWSGVWSDGETLWAVGYWGGEALAYDLATGARREGRDIALGGTKDQHAALGSDGETLWASSHAGGATAHRLSDGVRLAEEDLDAMLSAAGNDTPTGLWSDDDPDGATLYVLDHSDAHLYAYGADGARLESREFGLRGEGLAGWMWGLWSDGETLLTSYDRNGRVLAYRLSDGARQPERDIETGTSGNSYPRGLWSDGEVLWVADAAAGRLYAYAVPGLEAGRAETGLLPVRVSSRAAPVPSGNAGPAVAIPDPGLRGHIALALGKPPDAPVGANELAALESLDARDAGIADLTGLEAAVNLTALDLGDNPLSDLRALARLPRLTTLNLDRTGAEPWAVARLAGLERLSLRGNGIADVSALATLRNLVALDIGANAIEDLEALRHLASLRAVRADHNAITDIAPLAALESLETADLRDNAIRDHSPIAHSPARIDLHGNPVHGL